MKETEADKVLREEYEITKAKIDAYKRSKHTDPRP